MTRCVPGVTRNPDNAKEVTVPFGSIDDNTLASGDVFSLTIPARIGTNADGSKCPGHSNAVGLRLYYDAMQRLAQFGAALAPEPLITFYLRPTGGDVLDEEMPAATTPTSKDAPGLNSKNGNPCSDHWHLEPPARPREAPTPVVGEATGALGMGPCPLATRPVRALSLSRSVAAGEK